MAITGSYELLHQSTVINGVQQNSRVSVGAAVTGAVTTIDYDHYLVLSPQKKGNAMQGNGPREMRHPTAQSRMNVASCGLGLSTLGRGTTRIERPSTGQARFS